MKTIVVFCFYQYNFIFLFTFGEHILEIKILILIVGVLTPLSTIF